MSERSTSVDIKAPGGLTFGKEVINPSEEKTGNPLEKMKTRELY